MSKIRVHHDKPYDAFELQTDDTRSNFRDSLRGNCLTAATHCKLIAAVFWQESSPHRLSLDEAEKYANLFAAAPALLDACNSYAEVFDDDTCKILEAAKGDKYMVWLQGIITEIEAAIALAEKEGGL